MTLNHRLRGMIVASAFALPCLPGCGNSDSTNTGPGGGPSSGAAGSNGATPGTTGKPSGDTTKAGSADSGSGSGAIGSSLGGADTEPRRGSAATGVNNPGPS